jgi:hypothetical protein
MNTGMPPNGYNYSFEKKKSVGFADNYDTDRSIEKEPSEHYNFGRSAESKQASYIQNDYYESKLFPANVLEGDSKHTADGAG